MNKTLAIVMATLLTGFSAGSAWARTFLVPHTFETGGTAKAAEVNENFATAAAAIDDNDSRIQALEADVLSNTEAISALGQRLGPFQILSDGVAIGFFLGTTDPSSSGNRAIGNLYHGLSPSTYLFSIDTQPDLPAELVTDDVHFLTPDCSGPAYVKYGYRIRYPEARQGYIFQASQFSGVGPAYYVPKGSVLSVPMTPVSSGVAGTSDSRDCHAYTGSADVLLYAVFPNDPNITGLNAVSYPMPITIGWE